MGSRSSTSPTERSCCTSEESSRRHPRTPLKTRDDLSMAYTPGVTPGFERHRCGSEQGLDLDHQAEHGCDRLRRMDRVLGLGDIGPEAAFPLMEGKAGAVQGVRSRRRLPVCLATKDVDEIVRNVSRSPHRSSAGSTSRTSPRRCFEVERRLREALDIPSSTTTSTGPRSSSSPPSERAVESSVSDSRTADRRHRGWRSGRGDDSDATRCGCAGHHRLDREGALYRGRPGLSPEKAALCGAHEPARAMVLRRRRPVGARCLHQALLPGAVSVEAVRRWPIARSSSPWPTRPRGGAGGDRGLRGRDRDRPVRLPEPGQQRARFQGVPWRSGVRAREVNPAMELRCPGARRHRQAEDSRRTTSSTSSTATSLSPLPLPLPQQPRRRGCAQDAPPARERPSRAATHLRRPRDAATESSCRAGGARRRRPGGRRRPTV